MIGTNEELILDFKKVEKAIKSSFSTRTLKIQDLKRMFGINTNSQMETLNEILLDIQLKGEIYLDEDNKFVEVPKNYSVGEINTSSNGVFKKTIFNANNDRITLKEENLNGALNKDIVLLDRKAKKVIKIIKRKYNKVICEVIKENNNKYLKLIKTIGGDFLNLRISEKDMKRLVPGDIISVELSTEKNGEYFEAYFNEKICFRDDPDVELKMIASNHGFCLDFNEDVLEEAHKLPTEVKEEDVKNRIDLRKLNTFTIDGSHTKDMDDAVSIMKKKNGNFLLGVHIADVAYYIKEDSYLGKEAEKRGTSLYMIDTVIPMFPHVISNGICSLNENEDRLTKTCFIELSPSGKIEDFRIYDSVIKSKKKMTYEEVNEILQEKKQIDGYENYLEDLHLMKELSKILTRKREMNHYLKFNSEEIEFMKNEEGKTINVSPYKTGIAQEIIENFMICANEVIATKFSWMNQPSIYRVHDVPDHERVLKLIDKLKILGYRCKTKGAQDDASTLQSLLFQFKDLNEFPFLSKLILTNMNKALYTTYNIGHFALGLNNYTHFTSPIRRYPDFMILNLLNQLNKGEINNCTVDDNQLEEKSKHSSFKEREADEAEKEAKSIELIHYADSKIGEYCHGIVMEITSKAIFVQSREGIPGKISWKSLPPTIRFNEKKCYLEINYHPVLKSGDQVFLKITGTNHLELLADFDLIKNESLDRNNEGTKLKRVKNKY